MSFLAERNFKEMLRDRLNIMFGLGFPIIVLLLLTLIQAHAPVELFTIERLAPGVAIFGLSFVSLFSAMLLARDRDESFLTRLFSSPLSSKDYILAYTLPMLPLGAAQIACCFLLSFALGLKINLNCLLCLAVSIPAVVLFVAIGLLCGSLLTDKQCGGICGALLTNLTAWLSGTWFDTALLGSGFDAAAHALPFLNAVEAGRAALDGRYGDIWAHLRIVITYAAVLCALAILAFGRKMRSDGK